MSIWTSRSVGSRLAMLSFASFEVGLAAEYAFAVLMCSLQVSSELNAAFSLTEICVEEKQPPAAC